MAGLFFTKEDLLKTYYFGLILSLFINFFSFTQVTTRDDLTENIRPVLIPTFNPESDRFFGTELQNAFARKKSSSFTFTSVYKVGFLLVIIGFFMPVSCQMNGFELADTFMSMGDSVRLVILLYGVFICAFIGLIIGAALVIKKGASLN
ncbi:MAG: hypothetical protein LBV43_06465 [Prevotella sp.]|jgi:hypothetical protein|nr:hypothetical protein [Prevotella sp.]